jgi:hypothetical protein
MKNELSVDMTSLFNEASQSSSAPVQSSPQVDVSQPISDDGFEPDESSFWNDPNKEFGKFLGLDGSDEQTADEADAAPQAKQSKADQAVKSAELTYKANGKEHKLDLSKPEVIAEVQKKLAMADGMNKAFAEQAKYKQQMQSLQAELEEAKEYRDSWNKLENLRYDKAKMLEVLTGQKYEDFIAEEVAKHNIKTMGSEEERQMLTQQERIRQLEDRLKLGEEQTKKQQLESDRRRAAAEKAEEAAKQEWLKTGIEREFFKNVDDSMSDDVKELVYQKSILDLKKLHKTYGKLTNKMVEKTFAENSKRLKTYHQETVDTEVTKALGNKKQTATIAAKAASTKNYQPDLDNINLANLPADKLFQYFKFKNGKSK